MIMHDVISTERRTVEYMKGENAKILPSTRLRRTWHFGGQFVNKYFLTKGINLKLWGSIWLNKYRVMENNVMCRAGRGRRPNELVGEGR